MTNNSEKVIIVRALVVARVLLMIMRVRRRETWPSDKRHNGDFTRNKLEIGIYESTRD